MKKFFTIFSILLLAGCTQQVDLGAGEKVVNDISAAKVQEKYDAATKIKAKYQLNGTALERVAKDDPRDTIRVTVGDKPDPTMLGAGKTDFTPNVTISRWDEVSFTLKPKGLDTIATKDKALSFEGDKIKLHTPKVDYQMYELPVSAKNPSGAFEYEIDLLEKPATNVIAFDIDTQGLEFYYQPPLDEEMANSTCTETDCGDAHRPEDVVGSYAVYTAEQKTNWEGGKLYRTGKIGQYYRPRICDSKDWCVWGKFNKDLNTTHKLSVAMPTDFWEKAVYPVRHATGLEFGYHPGSGGTSGYSINNIVCLHPTVTPGQNGNVTSISAYLYAYTGYSPKTKTAVYTDDGSGTGTYVGTSEEKTLNTTQQWVTYNTSPNIAVSNINYYLCWWSDNYTYGKFDTTDNGPGVDQNNTYGTWLSNITLDVENTRKYWIYATYTAGGAAATGASTCKIKGVAEIKGYATCK
ncbi:MAG: hypothetical protein PHI63_04805 [Patescibacteria group bacterium]|nr:hypothetical protein [Patescibacteria group bacterium]